MSDLVTTKPVGLQPVECRERFAQQARAKEAEEEISAANEAVR